MPYRIYASLICKFYIRYLRKPISYYFIHIYIIFTILSNIGVRPCSSKKNETSDADTNPNIWQHLEIPVLKRKTNIIHGRKCTSIINDILLLTYHHLTISHFFFFFKYEIYSFKDIECIHDTLTSPTL